MRRKIILLAVVILFAAGQGLTANLSGVLKDAEAKYAKFEQEIKDMTITQEVKMITSHGDMTQDVEMFKKGKKFRMEFAMQMPQAQGASGGMQEMKTSIIYDGISMWMISPFTGKKKLSSGEGGQYQMQGDWWEAISDKAEVTGTENVDGIECYAIVFKTGINSPFTKMWLDKKNLLLVKAENKQAQDMVWVNSDFKKIKDDWEVPYKTQMHINGKLTSTSVVKSLEIDKGLQEDLFDPNKVEAKGFDMEEMMKNMMKGQPQK